LGSDTVPSTISVHYFDVVHCKRVRVYTNRPRGIIVAFRCLRTVGSYGDCVRPVGWCALGIVNMEGESWAPLEMKPAHSSVWP
jgi:hypothetical protein